MTTAGVSSSTTRENDTLFVMVGLLIAIVVVAIIFGNHSFNNVAAINELAKAYGVPLNVKLL